MQFSEAWLKSLVDPKLETRELGHLLTMAGLEVEAIDPVAAPFTQVVVAQILSADKHPNADRLQVCEVDVGEAEPLTIVCGAANARAGLKSVRPGFAGWSPSACCALRRNWVSMRLRTASWNSRPIRRRG